MGAEYMTAEKVSSFWLNYWTARKRINKKGKGQTKAKRNSAEGEQRNKVLLYFHCYEAKLSFLSRAEK